MTRPWRHPKTGVFWLRKRVPDDLRPIVGKLEEKQSLKTKDVGEAKVRLAQALIDLETKWSNLRRGVVQLTETKAHELAASVYDRWISIHADNPRAAQKHWNTRVGLAIWDPPPPLVMIPLELQHVYERADLLQQKCFDTADELLAKAGLSTDESGRARVAFAVSASMQRAGLALEKLAIGEAIPVSNNINLPVSAATAASYVSIDKLFADWALERNPAPKTRYEWERILRELKAFLGHDNAAQIKSVDLNGWKAKLLTAGDRPPSGGPIRMLV